MKKFVFSLIVVAGFLSCKTVKISSSKYSSLLEQNIKGPVSKVEQRRYSIDPVQKTLVEDTCCIFRQLFTKRGSNTRRESEDIKGILNRTDIYTYYPNGLIKETKQLNRDGKVVHFEQFQLNSVGKYEAGTSYENGKLYQRFKVLEQSEFGTWSRVEMYSPDGKLVQRQESKFDGNKLITQHWINADGKIARTLNSKFNDKGDHLEITIIAPVPGKDSTTTRTTRYIYDSYDQYDNWTQRSSVDAEGKVIKIIKRQFTYR